MLNFYKIENGVAEIGVGKRVPNGFKEYSIGSEPSDLILALSHRKPEEIKAEIEQAIQNMLDTKAKELRYDNMMSARSYAGYVNPFQVEAQALAVWCANCWIKAGELEALGTPMTVEEVLAQMPVFGV